MTRERKAKEIVLYKGDEKFTLGDKTLRQSFNGYWRDVKREEVRKAFSGRLMMVGRFKGGGRGWGPHI